MTESDSPAIAVYSRIVIGNAEFSQHRQTLAGKGFVEFNHIELVLLQAEPCHQLSRSRYRADAHDARRNSPSRTSENTGDRRQPVFLRRSFRGDDKGGRPIIDARGIA